MSRARAAKDRLPGDAYLTPELLALAACRWLKDAYYVRPVEVVEPSAGAGSWVKAAREVWPEAHVVANEVDRGRRRALLQAGAHEVFHEDWEALAYRLPEPKVTSELVTERLIVGNPPYRLATRHIHAAHDALGLGDGLLFLLRLNLLGGALRHDFWRAFPPLAVVPVVPRPSFTGGGTDGTEYALFLWAKGWPVEAGTRLEPPLAWRELPPALAMKEVG